MVSGGDDQTGPPNSNIFSYECNSNLKITKEIDTKHQKKF